MKKLILPLLLLISIVTHAQKQWTATDAQVYGTQQEHDQQEAISKQSQNDHLYHLIGFKQYYANGFSLWMQERGFAVENSDAGFVFNKNYVGSVKPYPVNLLLAVKDDRISSAKITGSFADLAQIFLYYWPTSPDFANASQLKPGVLAQKRLVNEVITFNYQNKAPVIIITKE